jgi:hypothetical protein
MFGGVYGGAAGMVAGALYALFGVKGDHRRVEELRKAQHSSDSPTKKTNNLLAELVRLTSEQNRVIVGNSARAGQFNAGDMQNAFLAIASKGVV